jgi:hypothetical protein
LGLSPDSFRIMRDRSKPVAVACKQVKPQSFSSKAESNSFADATTGTRNDSRLSGNRDHRKTLLDHRCI